MRAKMIVVVAFFLFFNVVPSASAYTVFNRYVHDDGKMVFYTIVVPYEDSGPAAIKDEVDKIFEDVFYKIYPQESATLKSTLEVYHLQIVVSKNGKTLAYMEYTLPASVVREIGERNAL